MSGLSRRSYLSLGLDENEIRAFRNDTCKFPSFWTKTHPMFEVLTETISRERAAGVSLTWILSSSLTSVAVSPNLQCAWTAVERHDKKTIPQKSWDETGCGPWTEAKVHPCPKALRFGRTDLVMGMGGLLACRRSVVRWTRGEGGGGGGGTRDGGWKKESSYARYCYLNYTHCHARIRVSITSQLACLTET